MTARRRRARALIALAALVALVVALLGVGNTAGRQYAEKRAAQAILDRSGLVSAVTIQDPAFVVSVLRQHFDQVDVAFPAMPISAGTHSLTPKVDISLHDVVATDGFSRFVAGTATATASLTWSQVSTLAGYAVTPDGSGISVTVSYNLYGISLTGTVKGTPVIEAGRLVLKDPTLSVANVQVPQAISDYLLKTVTAPVDLGLPSPFVATSLVVGQDGLQITATGTQVDVTSLG